MYLWRAVLLFVSAAALLVSCRFDRREDFDFSPSQPLRCGIFKSYYFVRDIQEEVYPDLGLLLANASRLRLTKAQKEKIESAARHCTELCELQKDHLKQMQEEIKSALALNEIHGDLTLLAKEVQAFEKAKAEWLSGHAARYRAGLKLLTPLELHAWQTAERELKALPAPTSSEQ